MQCGRKVGCKEFFYTASIITSSNPKGIQAAMSIYLLRIQCTKKKGSLRRKGWYGRKSIGHFELAL